MKSIKRLTALLLVLVMMFTLAPMAFAASDFSDVSKSDWFYAPVNWAVSKGITGGIGNNMFGPNNNCTREQVVTFLWADAGKPEPNATKSAFTDVKETDWFFKPVMWAVENGITSGLTATEFGTGKYCTRAQVATFLWAVAGKPSYGTPEKGFLDVGAKDWFYNPVMWAVANGITSGVSAGKFGPNNNCTRAQIATFMYAASPDYVKPEPTPTPVPTPTPKPTPEPIGKEDRVEIAAAYVSDIDSYGGVDLSIYWRNNTGKEINYIHFNCSFLDLNGAVMKHEYYPYYSTFDCWLKGPITTDNQDLSGDDPCTSDLYYIGNGIGGDPNFAIPQYDKEFDADYYNGYYNTADYGKKIYINPANRNHTYMSTHWENIMYNARVAYVRINNVVIEYADGTKETIYNPKVAPRTSPDEDRAYSQKFIDSLGCDVVGHDGSPTCTESALCKRCFEFQPATGHKYSYTEECTVCDYRFPSDITVKVGDIMKPVVGQTSAGKTFTFTVTEAYKNDSYDVDVDVFDGVPAIGFYVKLKYKYTYQGYLSSSDAYQVTVALRNEAGETVTTKTFKAYVSDTYEDLEMYVPESGTYYIDVYLNCDRNGHDAEPTCTESDVCSRCGQSVPALGHKMGANGVCTVCGELYQVDVTIINTMTPGVQLDTPGRIDAVDEEGRGYTLFMNGVERDDSIEPTVVVKNGAPAIEMVLNIPYRYEAKDEDCEIPVYNVEVDIYNSEGELVVTRFFNAQPGETNEALVVTLPGNDTYYVETHAEIFRAVAW